MPEDKHFNGSDQPFPEALADHKPSDMPAAKMLGIVLAITLVIGGVIAIITYRNANPEHPEVAPQDTSGRATTVLQEP